MKAWRAVEQNRDWRCRPTAKVPVPRFAAILARAPHTCGAVWYRPSRAAGLGCDRIPGAHAPGLQIFRPYGADKPAVHVDPPGCTRGMVARLGRATAVSAPTYVQTRFLPPFSSQLVVCPLISRAMRPHQPPGLALGSLLQGEKIPLFGPCLWPGMDGILRAYGRCDPGKTGEGLSASRR